MRHSIAILFFLVLGCSVATINFAGPAYAVYGGGANDDNGGSNDKGGPGGGVQKALVVTNVNLTSKDMKNIAQAFKDGKRFVTFTRVSGGTYWVPIALWNAFMPYEPGFTRKYLNARNNYDSSDIKSRARHVRFLRKYLIKFIKKLNVAIAVGTPAQVKIIKNMITNLNHDIVGVLTWPDLWN